MKPVFSARPAWAEIDLDAIKHNVKQIISLIGKGTEIMAVVKADGYGHGAAAIARAALAAGATWLSVAFVEEGVDLRREGIQAPILLLGYTDPAEFQTMVEFDLIPTVFSLDTALTLSEMAVEKKLKLPVHLKVDTGMSRVGLLPGEALGTIMQIVELPGLEVEGLLTHLAAAEDEAFSQYTEEQLALFGQIIDDCRKQGIDFTYLHTANSAAALSCPAARFNLVRIGLSLYGHYPSLRQREPGIQLQPALTLKSQVVMVKKLPKGTSISYGCTYRTADDALIATVPVGYADGYSRLLSNKGVVLIRGERAPVVGLICMDHLMIDVTRIPAARLGDEVVLYGRQGSEEITVEEVASLIGTVNYELLCAVDKRVSRFYFNNNRLDSVHDFIEDCLI
ncbi:MAG: alanine racemase [Bacillota bacterium]|nr:alanine racemase [Bacillota bacterium]